MKYLNGFLIHRRYEMRLTASSNFALTSPFRPLRGFQEGHRAERLVPVLERELAEAAERKRSQARIEALAKFPSEDPNPVLRVTADGAVLYANAVAHGIGRLFAGSRHAKLSKKLVAAVAEAARTGERREPEFVSGDRIYCVALAPVAGEAYINVYGRDITEERLAQRERRSAEARLRDAFDIMADGLAVYDSEGRLVLCNSSFRDIHQYSAADTEPGAATYDSLAAR